MGKPGESILLLNQALQEEDVGPQRSAASCQDICKGVASFVDIGVPGDDIGKSSPRDAAWRTYACRKQSRGTENSEKKEPYALGGMCALHAFSLKTLQ
jgi:hypothetical protein